MNRRTLALFLFCFLWGKNKVVIEFIEHLYQRLDPVTVSSYWSHPHDNDTGACTHLLYFWLVKCSEVRLCVRAFTQGILKKSSDNNSSVSS